MVAGSIHVGAVAPDFKAKATNDQLISLKDFRGKWIALYFYPKAFTPGCTKETCSLRDGYRELQKIGVVVLGISLDSLETQKRFKSEHRVPFELLSDEDKSISKAYDTLGLLGLYSQRKTFIIDPTGKIATILNQIDTNHHDQQLLKVMKELQGMK
ncbi:MAG: peroxiredoxin [Deltaproteobacteria bacterium]|nr:peroxiredoxin [Deltaproteobacteria bacterium]